MDIFAERIDPEKEKLGIKDADFERRIGVTPRSVYKWRHGLSRSYIDYIVPISKLLNTSVDYLLGYSDEKIPASTNGDGLEAQISHLPPALQEQLARFVELASTSPDNAERYLAFAVQELLFSQQDS